VEERVYEGEFDDVKTDAGERQVPFDRSGLMKSALVGRWNASQHRQPDDLVFSTRKGGVLGRRNLLRHIKIAAAKLGLSSAVDLRSFRTMHSSLMLREGARPEVVRDNMGHANIDVTQNVYGKSWWEERVDAVSRAVEAVSAAAQSAKNEGKPDQPESSNNEWVPQWAPQQEAKIASC
jgi:integrase